MQNIYIKFRSFCIFIYILYLMRRYNLLNADHRYFWILFADESFNHNI